MKHKAQFFKKVKWIKTFYFFYLFLIWLFILGILSFFGWQGYLFLSSDLFLINSPYNIEFRIIKEPEHRYLDFDDYLIKWRNDNFSNYGPFFIYRSNVLKKKLRTHFFIDNFYIDKRYPNSLSIHYSVREPVMRLQLTKEERTEAYIIDREGYVIIKSKDSLIKQIPDYITQGPYSFSQSGWRGHREIQYCLDLLAKMQEDSRLQNVYWQLEGISYSNPDEIFFKFRNKGEFIVHAQNIDELLIYLRQEMYNLSDLNGRTIIIRGERE